MFDSPKIQSFLIQTADACERYLLGKRPSTIGDEESWCMTATRIVSMVFIIPPLAAGLCFIAAVCFIKPNQDKRKYWKNLLSLDSEMKTHKKTLINALMRSGIDQTNFKTIYIVRGPTKVHAGDGCLAHLYFCDKTEEEKRKCLTIYFLNKCLSSSAVDSAAKGVQDTESNICWPSTFRVITHGDFELLSTGKISNRLKDILIKGPNPGPKPDEEIGL